MRHFLFIILMLLGYFAFAQKEGDWKPLFDGKSLNGWKPSNNQAFKVENGAIVINGPASVLTYNGKLNKGTFKNFELKAEVLTNPGAIASLFFHSNGNALNPTGYEVQINNAPNGENNKDIRRTGSLVGIRNLYFPTAKDNEWFTLLIRVEENQVAISINGIQANLYVESNAAFRPDNLKNRIFSSGTFAIKAGDTPEKVSIRNIMVKSLPEGTRKNPEIDYEADQFITQMHASGLPSIDFHVHVKGGMTLDDAINFSQKMGINIGLAANCGLMFPVTNDEQLNEYLNDIQHAPLFKAMQAEGREWMTLFSPKAISRFDYVFTDAMTWTNKNGKRLRLWIPEETEVGDPQDFMEQITSQIEKIVTEPIDIYVNPTYLPDEISNRYDELWTEERMDRVIQALLKNDVALEINARYKIPSIKFIKRAKDAGVKFTFGTNNTSMDDLEYSYIVQAIEETNLKPSDIWLPRKDSEKKIFKYMK